MNPIHVDKTEGLYIYTRDRQIHQSNTAIVRGPAKNKLKRHGALLVVGMKQVVATNWNVLVLNKWNIRHPGSIYGCSFFLWLRRMWILL